MFTLLTALFGPDAGLPLPLTRIKEVSWFSALLEYPPIKALVPIPILIALWPLVRRFFKSTWEELDAEARRLRLELPQSEYDYRRPVACFAIVAVVLTLQEYYGGRAAPPPPPPPLRQHAPSGGGPPPQKKQKSPALNP